MRYYGMFVLALTLGVTSYSDESSIEEIIVRPTQEPGLLQEKLRGFGFQELEGLLLNIDSPTIYDRPILNEVGVFELTGRIMCKIIQINFYDPYGGPILEPSGIMFDRNGDDMSSTLDMSHRSYRGLEMIEVLRGSQEPLYERSLTGREGNVEDTNAPIEVRMMCYPIDDMDATWQPSMIDMQGFEF